MNPLLSLAVAAAMSATPSLRAVLLSPGSLPWDASVVDASPGLERLGFRKCRLLDADNPFTVGPVVNCEAGDDRLSVGYRRWETGVHLEGFAFFLKDALSCRRLLEAVARGGYSWSRAEDGERVLKLPGSKAAPARSGTFQLRASCTAQAPRLDLTWSASPK